MKKSKTKLKQMKFNNENKRFLMKENVGFFNPTKSKVLHLIEQLDKIDVLKMSFVRFFNV